MSPDGLVLTQTSSDFTDTIQRHSYASDHTSLGFSLLQCTASKLLFIFLSVSTFSQFQCLSIQPVWLFTMNGF